MNIDMIVKQRDDLLSALEVLVGSNDVGELEGMAKVLQTVMNDADAAASLKAICVLINVKNEIKETL